MHLSLSESKLKAEKVACAYHTPRYKKLDRLERYAKGTQYEGRPSFWNNDVPLQERAPYLRAPIAERAIRGHVDLSLGEGRFPRLTTHLSEDDSAFDPDTGLSKKESETLDRFICAIVDQAKLCDVSVDAMTNGLECGTAVAIARITDEQELAVDIELAKHCTPTYDKGKLVRLDIRYPYIAEVERKDPGEPVRYEYECRLYRRTIDTMNDTTFIPGKASETGGEPDSWTPDPSQTFAHNLGFVPAHWWRRGKKRTTAAEIDGCAIHATLLDEIDGLNLSLSQRHRAARYAGDPQIVEYGVESEDDVKAPMGRSERTMHSGDGDHPRNRSYVLDHQGKPMRRKGPGSIWTYTDKGAKCEYLTLPAGALESLEGDIKELYAMLRDAMGYVDSDPANIKIGGDVSGKTLEWLHQNAVNFCNRLRPDFADGFLIPVVSLLLRLVFVANAKGEALRIPGFAKAAPIVSRFEQNGKWQPPTMRAIWGEYFKPTEQDKKAKQERVLAAYEAGIITEQTAVEEIATLYPTIKDPAAYLKTLEEERQAKQAKLHDAKAALLAAGQPPMPVDDTGAPVDEGMRTGNEPVPIASSPTGASAKNPKPVPKAPKEVGKPVSIPARGKPRREVVRTKKPPKPQPKSAKGKSATEPKVARGKVRRETTRSPRATRRSGART